MRGKEKWGEGGCEARRRGNCQGRIGSAFPPAIMGLRFVCGSRGDKVEKPRNPAREHVNS